MNARQSEARRNVADGFFFALDLLASLSVQFDPDAVMRRVAEVARGETTLQNSPEEDGFEVRMRQHLRVSIDDHHRLCAVRVVWACQQGKRES